jgi:hypothetical protein
MSLFESITAFRAAQALVESKTARSEPELDIVQKHISKWVKEKPPQSRGEWKKMYGTARRLTPASKIVLYQPGRGDKKARRAEPPDTPVMRRVKANKWARENPTPPSTFSMAFGHGNY